MKIKTLILVIIAFLGGLYIAPYFIPRNSHFHEMQMREMREEHLSEKDQIVKLMLSDEKYKCCLENPCTYCIEKTPGHGEGASCNCLTDIIEGSHPCGECIGEILEGHGNRFLAKYFASAIAEEVGSDYLDSLKSIIADKYNISLEDQI